jgi:glutamate:GABA antiporter
VKNEKKQYMQVKSMVIMLVLAMVGIRWFPFGAKNGPACIALWILAAIILFIPMALMVAEFGILFPKVEGGFTGWIKEVLGERMAFISSWYYFFCVLFYIPAVLAFAGVCFAYVINPELADNPVFISGFVIISFWIMIFLSSKSLDLFQKMSSINGFFGAILPIFILIFSALYVVLILKKPVPTNFSLSSFIPTFNADTNIILLIAMATGVCGIELAGPFVSNMKNPRKEFPKAILLSAIIIVVAYILGSLSLLLIESPDKFSTVNGVVEIITIIAAKLNLSWLAILLFLMMTVGNLGIAIVWLVGGTKMVIEGNDPKIFPKFLTKKTKNNIPQNALVVQGVIITLIMLVNATLPSVHSLYEILVMMTSIFMFIAYMFMFYAYLTVKWDNTGKYKNGFKLPGGKVTAFIIFALPAIVCCIAIGLSIINPIGNTFTYLLQIVGGPIIFGIIGIMLYESRNKSSKFTINKSTT